MGAKVRKHRFNIGRKMYIFVIITVLMAAIGITVLAYFINVNQIDTYFKNLALCGKLCDYGRPEFS